MKKAKITLWVSLALISSFLYQNITQNHPITTGLGTSPVTGAELGKAMEANIQILLFSTESLEALGVDHRNSSLKDALSTAEVAYGYGLGLGTLVNQNGEIILITHDHWGNLDKVGMVQFRNAAGDSLLELDGDTFKDLIRYQDGGTMILGRSVNGDRSDYLSALVSITQAKYGRRIVPTEFESGESVGVGVGQELMVVQQSSHSPGHTW